MKETLDVIRRMQADGIIGRYAILESKQAERRREEGSAVEHEGPATSGVTVELSKRPRLARMAEQVRVPRGRAALIRPPLKIGP